MKFSIIAICLIVLGSCTRTGKPTEPMVKDSIGTKEQTETASRAATNNKSILFLWRANVYNAEIKDSVSTLFVNETYCKNIPDAERAALGYVATFIGSECWWDGEPDGNRGNLKCKILTALDLGYQCSEKHLGFLRNWFKEDKKVLAKLEACPTIPYTATQQSTFDEIKINTQSDTIRVDFKATYINVREDKATQWAETNTFLLENGQLRLLSVKSSR